MGLILYPQHGNIVSVTIVSHWKVLIAEKS